MKKIIITSIVVILAFINCYAQTTISGYGNPGHLAPPGSAWNTYYVGWNNNQIPLWFNTNGLVRARLNNSSIVNINGVNQNVTGYFGIGLNNYFATETPMAMLHLEGPNNTPGYTGNGWRSWMQTGTFMRENSDAMYVGLQTQPGAINRSDAVINWSDDISDQYGGADRLKIVMSTYANTGNGNNQSRIDGASYFGYEFMQFTPSNYQNNSANFPAGFVGIGPVFTSTSPSNPNSRPQSRLHINSEESLETWLQISNMDGTGQLATDGFRMGITSDGTANLRQQENKPMVFYTDWDNTSGGVTGGERMRIMSVGMPGVPNPGGIFATNTTRVAISHNGGNPITAPRSLLHLGYNTGGNSSSQVSPDGWRSWMDIGMFTSNGTDHVYLGLKNQGTTDRNDAVLCWGDNQGIPGTQQTLGPDNLLFVFTATQTGIATPPASGQTGVEGMRMTPTLIGVNTGIGGDPTTNPYFGNIENPTQTLEVNSPATTASATGSGLRFTDLNANVTPLSTNPGTGVLAVDANGDVIYVKNSATGVANAENGCSVNGSSKVVLGNDVGATSAILIKDREIPMDKFNILFTQRGRIGIGDNFTAGATMPASKLEIYTDDGNDIALKANSDLHLQPVIYKMNQIENRTTGSLEGTSLYIHTGGSSLKRSTGIDVLTNTDAGENVGVNSSASDGQVANSGGKFYAGSPNSIASNNTGLFGFGGFSNGDNTGGVFQAGNPQTATGGYNGISNIGVYAKSFGGQNCYGIYAEAIGGSQTNYAGYFSGDVYISGSYGPSDIMLKENITPLTNSTSIINQLAPKNFTFKTTQFAQMNLPTGSQYGLIAQDVEQVLPELVKNVTQPAVLDSLGNVITPAVNFKSVKYESFIPILIQGVKEVNAKNDSTVAVLNTRIDSLQDVISNFNNRLNQFENQLNECCSHGNHGNHNSKSTLENNSNITEVTLENSNTILLEQNVPNPFAESTVINYFIPENIKYAQLLFSDNFGRIIKTVDIETSGAGTIKVYASNLSQGTYTYSLIIDGKVVETKKMVCVK